MLSGPKRGPTARTVGTGTRRASDSPARRPVMGTLQRLPLDLETVASSRVARPPVQAPVEIEVVLHPDGNAVRERCEEHVRSKYRRGFLNSGRLPAGDRLRPVSRRRFHKSPTNRQLGFVNATPSARIHRIEAPSISGIHQQTVRNRAAERQRAVGLAEGASSVNSISCRPQFKAQPGRFSTFSGTCSRPTAYRKSVSGALR
jgi:hypothetical protein